MPRGLPLVEEHAPGLEACRVTSGHHSSVIRYCETKDEGVGTDDRAMDRRCGLPGPAPLA